MFGTNRGYKRGIFIQINHPDCACPNERSSSLQTSYRRMKEICSAQKIIPNLHHHFIEAFEEQLEDKDSNGKETGNQVYNTVLMDTFQSTLK